MTTLRITADVEVLDTATLLALVPRHFESDNGGWLFIAATPLLQAERAQDTRPLGIALHSIELQVGDAPDGRYRAVWHRKV